MPRPVAERLVSLVLRRVPREHRADVRLLMDAHRAIWRTAIHYERDEAFREGVASVPRAADAGFEAGFKTGVAEVMGKVGCPAKSEHEESWLN